MKNTPAAQMLTWLVASILGVASGHAETNHVVIGNIDDMSSVYADVIGQGGIEAAKMAIADFGGEVLGSKIEFLSFDHQNKPDIANARLREWADRNGLTMLLGGSNTGVSIAMAPIASEKKIPFFAIGAAGASLTGKDCTPYTVHYAYDTTALSKGTATAILKEGGKSWYFLTADYAFGTQLEQAASDVVKAGGGKVLGSVRVPLSTVDFSSFLLQAQGSGAQVLGLANAGTDFTNSVKATNEFGLVKTMKPAALLAFISDIHALGLETAQGLYLTTGWYWDLNDKTRAFAKRFAARNNNKMPTSIQAGFYSAALQYLNAVKAAGTDNSDTVMAKLKEIKWDDPIFGLSYIRADGRKMHDMYLFEVKKPSESKGPYDYYKLISTMAAEEAFRPLDQGECPMIKKN